MRGGDSLGYDQGLSRPTDHWRNSRLDPGRYVAVDGRTDQFRARWMAEIAPGRRDRRLLSVYAVIEPGLERIAEPMGLIAVHIHDSGTVIDGGGILLSLDPAAALDDHRLFLLALLSIIGNPLGGR